MKTKRNPEAKHKANVKWWALRVVGMA